jgi:hypothetical protein
VLQAILLILATPSCGFKVYIPTHRYHAMPLPGFEPTTLWLRVRRPNHLATMLPIRQVMISTIREMASMVSARIKRPSGN